MKEIFLKKILKKNAVIGVIGLGYVGLPLIMRFSEVGYKVVGFDLDAEKIKALNSGRSYIQHIPNSCIESCLSKGFMATNDFSKFAEVDALVICVPTPLNKYREPDLSYVISTIETIVPYLRKGQLVSLESTTYPGTTEEELLPRMESGNLKVGRDIFLVYSPEREDPGNNQFKTQTIPKIVGGITPSCLEVGVCLYGEIVDEVVPVSSTKAAELTKLLENIHRSVNIGLVNEMKIVADKMEINIHEVIRAASTKPFGFTPYYPGPGLGGHCIPIDPFYLTWKAREYHVNTRFIELAGEINTGMPKWVIGKVVEALNTRRMPLNGSSILILGIAYKKNIDDIRESPALELARILKEGGAFVEYSDPYIHSIDIPTSFDNNTSVEMKSENISRFDLILIATNHDSFDYQKISLNAKLIVDTRGVYRDGMANIFPA